MQVLRLSSLDEAEQAASQMPVVRALVVSHPSRDTTARWMGHPRVAGEPASQRLYSARRASVGLTEAARAAGMMLAASEAAARTIATAARVVASQAATPKRSLRMASEAAMEQARPRTTPITVSHAAWRRIIR